MEEAAAAASMAKLAGRPQVDFLTQSGVWFGYSHVRASVLNRIPITLMRHDVYHSYISV